MNYYLKYSDIWHGLSLLTRYLSLFNGVSGFPNGLYQGDILFLHSYEAEFVQELLRKGEKKLAQSFNYTFGYIVDVLSLNNKNSSNVLHLIYPVDLVVKYTTDSPNQLPTLTITSNMTLMEPWQPNFMTKVTILTFLSSTIPFSTVTSRHLLHMVFTYLGWFDIQEPVILIRIFYIDLPC